jgi:5,10-methylenetetrahydromethanopterin reductase
VRTSIWLFPDRPVEELVAAARAAEAAGLDAFWLGDEGVAREPFTVLTAAGLATRRIELGVAVTNPYLRHPALTASTAATVAEAVGRRVHLGFGPGGRATLEPVGARAMGRVPRLRSAIRIARAVLASEKTPGFSPGPFAWKAPAVNLWVGGRGPAVASLAGELADGFFCNVAKPLVGPLLARVRAHSRPVRVALSFPVVLDKAQREAIRPYLALALLDAPPGTPEAVGIATSEAKAALAALAAGDPSAAARHISDRVLANLVVQGPAQAAAAELADMARAHQADELTAAVWGEKLPEMIERVGKVLREAAALALRPGTPGN